MAPSSSAGTILVIPKLQKVSRPTSASQHSKLIDNFSPSDFDIVIFMCSFGATTTDMWKEGKRSEDWNVEDPINKGAEEFVKAREEIESRMKEGS
ncbi:hypothetical protein BC938DRAFT_483581 [Jimgerdemannia flammicorona]|uniref:Uncharacterized protein n=1 Tax=Jimgerdemannia flammicorona TaxID=994334 RepID=A0A433QBS2_9FUNG|nr:hypothetical protein BC938DRAFT_483581 [Jimgerdemannia flammicorona]